MAVICPACHSIGQVREPLAPPRKGHRWIKCTRCRGTGFITDNDKPPEREDRSGDPAT